MTSTKTRYREPTPGDKGKYIEVKLGRLTRVWHKRKLTAIMPPDWGDFRFICEDAYAEQPYDVPWEFGRVACDDPPRTVVLGEGEL